jgi:HEAT repeat protein
MTPAAALEEALRSAEPETRRRALRELPSLAPPDAVRLVLVALGDDDWRVRKEAVLTVRELAPRDLVIAGLTAALGDAERVGLRNACVEALVQLGTDAVPPTLAALANLDADGRKLAVEVLGGVADVRAVRALASALNDPDPNVRCAAADALGSAAASGEEAREDAIGALLGVLARPEESALCRLAALEALDRLEARVQAGTLAPYLADATLRRPALRMLARAEGPVAVGALASALADGSSAVRRDAAQALANRLLAEGASTALRARVREELLRMDPAWLRDAARDPDDPPFRAAALLLAGLRGEEADLDVVLEALDDPELEARVEHALHLAGPGSVEVLVQRLRAGPTSRHVSALPLALRVSAPPPPTLVELARLDLGDSSPEVVASAARVLATYGSAEDLERLAELLDHDDARVAGAAELAFRERAASAPELARRLVADVQLSGPRAVAACLVSAATGDGAFAHRALRSGDARVRRAALEALAAIGDRAALGAVELALADEERDVRLAAIRALGRLGAPDALATLAATAPDAETAGAALRALGDVEPQRAFEIARRMVEDADAARACVAVEGISRHVGPLREDALLAALEHEDAGVLTLAMTELAASPTPRAVLRLGMALDHPSWEVRRLAAELLGSVGDASSEALLRARLDREADPGVREALQQALLHRGGA